MKILVVLVITALISVQALANSSFQKVEISGVILHDSGRVLISVSEPLSHSEGCDKNTFLVLLPEQPLFNEIYSTVLASYFANQQINGWVNECHPSHKGPILTRLDISK